MIEGIKNGFTCVVQWLTDLLTWARNVHDCYEYAVDIDEYYTDWKRTETSVCTRYVKHKKIVKRCDVCGEQWSETMPEQFDKVKREWKE